jgi:predicted aminopeptidase
MDIQYLSDEQGRQTAVQIPIDEWNKLTAEHEVFRNYEQKKKKPSDFRGAISKNTAEQLLQYATQSRTEWDRNIS